MFRYIFVLTLIILTVATSSLAGGKLTKQEVRIVSVNFCSSEREGVCVQTDMGQKILQSPYSLAIDNAGFKELFFLLHLNCGSPVTLILSDQDGIVGMRTPHYEFIAQELDGKKFKPRAMP